MTYRRVAIEFKTAWSHDPNIFLFWCCHTGWDMRKLVLSWRASFLFVCWLLTLDFWPYFFSFFVYNSTFMYNMHICYVCIKYIWSRLSWNHTSVISLIGLWFSTTWRFCCVWISRIQGENIFWKIKKVMVALFYLGTAHHRKDYHTLEGPCSSNCFKSILHAFL